MNNIKNKGPQPASPSPSSPPITECIVSQEIIADLQTMNILVVHPNPDCLLSIKNLLNAHSLNNIITAESLEQAYSQLRNHHDQGVSTIHLILMHVLPPTMEGYTLCRHLRSQSAWTEIPIIMLAADDCGQEEMATQSFAAGAMDIITQPLRQSELIPRVLFALTLKRERDLRKHREYELETELAERKVMEARLQYLVEHDDLTGLFNRRHLEVELETAVSHAQRDLQSSALLYIDLDQFKVINDTEGHAAGDRLLIHVSNRLRRHVGPNTILAHISSDEFTVLLANTKEAEAIKVADTIRRLMDDYRYTIDNRSYHVGASIGIAMINPGENINASEVLARADQACHIAKTHGRNTIYLFNHADIETLTLRSTLFWVPQIRNALANNEFILMFQPVLNLQENTINRYEVLLRMYGDNKEIITPENFIPIAEYMGLIHDIDLWVVENTINIINRLPRDRSHISVNINLSSHAFQDTSLPAFIQEKLRGSNVQAKQITFELTETAAVANFSQSRNLINQIKKLGCRFALDDFGSGFNSFNYIKQFPVDYLKIDGTFITNLLNDHVDQTLVKSMIKIAKTLKIQTVAEFVENAEILNLLRGYKVDYAQGYHIGPPSPAETLINPLAYNSDKSQDRQHQYPSLD